MHFYLLFYHVLYACSKMTITPMREESARFDEIKRLTGVSRRRLSRAAARGGVDMSELYWNSLYSVVGGAQVDAGDLIYVEFEASWQRPGKHQPTRNASQLWLQALGVLHCR